jgi:hypothetical protein
MKLCILKSDQEDFVQLMEMYDIQFVLLDSIVYDSARNEDLTELIYLAVIDPNMENQYFNWFELGQMFERHKFAGHRRVVENMKKELQDKLKNITPDATI